MECHREGACISYLTPILPKEIDSESQSSLAGLHSYLRPLPVSWQWLTFALPPVGSSCSPTLMLRVKLCTWPQRPLGSGGERSMLVLGILHSLGTAWQNNSGYWNPGGSKWPNDCRALLVLAFHLVCVLPGPAWSSLPITVVSGRGVAVCMGWPGSL